MTANFIGQSRSPGRRVSFENVVERLYGLGRDTDGRLANLRKKMLYARFGTMLEDFDSLGGTCEFAMFHQHCGVDRVGLLRFANIPVANLARAIDERFEKFRAGEVSLNIDLPRRGEYIARQPDYEMQFHTWQFEWEIERDTLRDNLARKWRFLARKLIEDFERGDRLFVYRFMAGAGPADVARVARAIRKHGPATVLWVRESGAGNPPGSVEFVEDGLMHGFVTRFAPDNRAADFHVAGWLELCRNARAAWRAARGKNGEAAA